MGISGVGVWQLLIIFGIAMLIFGTSRLKNIGGDLGGAIKGFRKAMEHDDRAAPASDAASVEPMRIAVGCDADGGAGERSEAKRHV